MKKRVLIPIGALFIFIIILSISKVDASIISFPLLGKIIYLDAGHGGLDSGAISNNIKEKDINLQIILKLKEKLEATGATVLLTRKDDNDLANKNATRRKKSDFDNRINLINTSKADLYISIHQNQYYNDMYYGPQVFYIKGNENLATIVQEELNYLTKTKRKIKTINNVYMYKRINKPGILIECGFLSNKTERNKLNNPKYQEELSTTITNALIKYYSIK